MRLYLRLAVGFIALVVLGVPAVKRVSLVLGSVEVPGDCTEVITTSLSDAFYGYVQCTSSGPRVGFSVGTVEKSVTRQNRSEFVWQKIEASGSMEIRYGLGRGNRQSPERQTATNGPASDAAPS